MTIQTLDRHDGNGITMVFVDANDPATARYFACDVARRRFHCEVVADHPIECPGFHPSADAPTVPRRSSRST